MIKKEYLLSELIAMFKDIVYSGEAEFAIYCAFNNGIYVDEDKKPDKGKIDHTREAIITLGLIYFDSLEEAKGRDIPVSTIMASMYDALGETYSRIMKMVGGDLDGCLLNAFFFRLFAYFVQMLIEELFFDEPVEEICIEWDCDPNKEA